MRTWPGAPLVNPNARGDHQQLARFERRSQRLNRLDLVLRVLRKLREVVAEREVHHSIHPLRSAAQAVEVLQVAAMNLCARRLQLPHAGIAPRKAAYLVPCRNQLLHQFRSNETRCSRHKYTHRCSSCGYDATREDRAGI